MKVMCFRNGSEFIEITRADNGRYFIDYGVTFTKPPSIRKVSECCAGPFESFSESYEILKRHRPVAEQIKPFCTDCHHRRMLTWDPDLKRDVNVPCNGIPYGDPYSGCVCKN